MFTELMVQIWWRLCADNLRNTLFWVGVGGWAGWITVPPDLAAFYSLGHIWKCQGCTFSQFSNTFQSHFQGFLWFFKRISWGKLCSYHLFIYAEPNWNTILESKIVNIVNHECHFSGSVLRPPVMFCVILMGIFLFL